MIKISKFEEMIITDIIEHNPDYREILLSQFNAAKVKERKKYERGFCTDYVIDDGVQTFGDGVDMRLSGSQWNINDVDNGTDYILWVKNGKISSLEGFTYEEKWPDEIIWEKKTKLSDTDMIFVCIV